MQKKWSNIESNVPLMFSARETANQRNTEIGPDWFGMLTINGEEYPAVLQYSHEGKSEIKQIRDGVLNLLNERTIERWDASNLPVRVTGKRGKLYFCTPYVPGDTDFGTIARP